MFSARTVLPRLLLALGVFLSHTVPARAADVGSREFDLKARKVIHIELEMQRINCRLNLEVANPNFWRMRRTWLYDTSNALATEGGLIAATALFYDHAEDRFGVQHSISVSNGKFGISERRQDHHDHVSGRAVAGELYPQIIGQAIGGSGSYFELATDYGRFIRLRREHLDRHAVTERQFDLDKQANDLLHEMSLLLNGRPEEMSAEIKLLKDIKKECLREFVRLEGRAANMSAGRWIEDGISATRNTVGLIGNSINVNGVLRNSRIINGDGSILNLVSASLITIRPFLSNTGSYLANRENNRLTRRYFPELYRDTTSPDLDGDLRRLYAEADGDEYLASRKAIYQEQLSRIRDDREIANDEKKRRDQTAARRYRESLYGPAKQAQSIMSIESSFRRGDNSTIIDRISAAGNTTYMTGQAFNIMELMRERVVDERAHNQQKRESMLPEQRLHQQLGQLEKMERQLTTQ
jgi:hypothetical protein